MRDRERSVEELHRALVPGGRLAVATWTRIEESSGYAAMVELVERLFGPATADALRAPFTLGDPAALVTLVRPGFPDVAVSRRSGTARFPSIDAWVHTDIRGWTLSDEIDEDGYALLLTEARVALAPFVGADGAVSFPAPALIATATRPPERGTGPRQ